MKYFKNCKTLEELKKEYKRLMIKYHPDLNKDENATNIAQAINNEYDQMFEVLKNAYNNKTENKNKQTYETPEYFKNIINILITCEGLKIEIIGSWLWIGGDTFKHKDIIKSLGFAWSKAKKLWYLSDNGNKFTGKKKGQNIEDIRNKYGSQTIETQKAVYIG